MENISPNSMFKMEQMRRIISACFMFLMVYGCSIISSCKSLPTVCGAYPENYQDMIMDYLAQDLTHPDSIKDFKVIKAPEVLKMETTIPFLGLKEGFEVWEFFIVYDVKNDDGVYIGRDLHVVWIRDNRLIAFDYEALNPAYRMTGGNNRTEE